MPGAGGPRAIFKQIACATVKSSINVIVCKISEDKMTSCRRNEEGASCMFHHRRYLCLSIRTAYVRKFCGQFFPAGSFSLRYKQTIIMKPYHYIEALSQKRGFVSLFALTLRFQKCPLWRARFMLDRVGRHTYVALGGVCRARQNTRLIT